MPGNVHYLDPAVRWKHRFPGMAEREPSSVDVVAEILDTRFADEVLGRLASGKEADIYLVAHRGAPLVAKVYRLYRQAGKTGAIPLNRFSFLAAIEFERLYKAFRGGVRVPAPAGRHENIVFMRFLGDDSAAAPRLVDAPPEDPRACLDSVLDEVARLLAVGIVHGDLSAFNILMHEGRPWLIDFSYATAFRRPKEKPWDKDPVARADLLRDCASLAANFRKFGLPVMAEDLLSSLRERTASGEASSATSP